MLPFLKSRKNPKEPDVKKDELDEGDTSSLDSRELFFRKYSHLPDETKKKLAEALDEWENES